MKIALIQVPYHVGRYQVGVGLGPISFIKAGAGRRLSDQGFEVRVEAVESEVPTTDELSAISEVNAHVARRVEETIADGFAPIVLAGDCNSCLGTLAGLGSSPIGIIWFDAHGDFNTPGTTTSGFFEGMPLAVASGRCYPDVWTRIGNSMPIPDSHILLVGVRDLDPGEREILEDSEVNLVTAHYLKDAGVNASLLQQLTRLKSRIGEVYLHIDVDVINLTEAPGVDFRCPGGLTSSEVQEAVQMIARHFRIKGATLAAFNPTVDEDEKTLRTGLNLLEAIANSVSTEPKRGK